MKKSYNSAFSLIEISIAILIIGILIAGVIQGSKMYNAFKLQVARALTVSSPVAGVKDLMLWYETSLESSFKTTESVDGTTISVWYDNNPQKIERNNATQTTSNQRPTFYENAVNGIPMIRFDAVNDYLNYDGTFLANTNYTVFVVEQRRGIGPAAGTSFFISGMSGSDYGFLRIGYGGTALIQFAHSSYNLNYTIPSYSEPIPRIHTFWFNKTYGKKYWENGGNNPDATDTRTQAKLVLDSYTGAIIGKHLSCCQYYNGDIAEIIIYVRDLITEERQSVEDYLSKKYAITITQ